MNEELSEQRHLNLKKLQAFQDIPDQENNKEILEDINFKKNPRLYAILIYQYGFIILLIIILLLLYLIPEYHYPKIFTSKIENIPFDSSYTPKIFLHITDIYLTEAQPLKLNGALLFLKSFLNYKPDLILITGNIVDNYNEKKSNYGLGIGRQTPKDWKIYNTSLRNHLSKYQVIDVAGNNDIWGVDSANSKLNMFLDHSFIFNRSNVENDDDFTIKKVKMLNITFILFNDYIFPTPFPPYTEEPHTSKHQLDLLENMIENLDEECYILTHYHVDRIWFQKSSKGNNFEKIISNEKVAGIFTGYSSKDDIRIIHHSNEGGLEYNSPSIYNNKRSGLITYDNGNLIYHSVYIPYPGNQTLFFLSYPVPNDQISRHHTFNLNNFEIRVISFASEKNIILKIEGDIKGELSYKQTLNNGAFLYSIPVNLPDGSYKIHIYDESNYYCNINTEFTIAKEYKSKKEKTLLYKNVILGGRFISILVFIYIFIIIIPFWKNINFKLIDNIESYIEGNDKININKFLIIFYLFILGPLITRKEFQKFSKLLRYSILFAFVYPLILPIHFLDKINGKFGFVYNVFIIFIGTNIRYNNSALEILFIYYSFIILPFVYFICLIKYYNSERLIYFLIYNFIAFFFYL